jgi:hypothetical protein
MPEDDERWAILHLPFERVHHRHGSPTEILK